MEPTTPIHVSQVLPSAVSTMSCTAPTGPQVPRPPFHETDRGKVIVQRVNVLFAEMHSLKPFAFRKAWPTQERISTAKRQFLAVREFRLLTDAQFKFGLDRLRATMVWPTSPAEFLELCRNPEPEALGAPSLAEAYHQVMRYENAPADLRDLAVMHPATYWAWRQINHSVWRKQDAKRHEATFAAHYQRAMKAALSGEEFPPPPRLLAKVKSPYQPNRDLGNQALARIRTSLFRGPQP